MRSSRGKYVECFTASGIFHICNEKNYHATCTWGYQMEGLKYLIFFIFFPSVFVFQLWVDWDTRKLLCNLKNSNMVMVVTNVVFMVMIYKKILIFILFPNILILNIMLRFNISLCLKGFLFYFRASSVKIVTQGEFLALLKWKKIFTVFHLKQRLNFSYLIFMQLCLCLEFWYNNEYEELENSYVT